MTSPVAAISPDPRGCRPTIATAGIFLAMHAHHRALDANRSRIATAPGLGAGRIPAAGDRARPLIAPLTAAKASGPDRRRFFAFGDLPDLWMRAGRTLISPQPLFVR
jgi:hypothetical protein